ncbi:MAG: site-specific DNA-methyltransferase, partial [Candidatus Stahlbacteria bacterium]|nr:site-specific DNA-methyltransferase [Candidatus Stahlbacteria bacterium]
MKYQLKTNTIYCGDCMKMLKDIPDNSIDLIYIDPPFNSNRNYETFWGDIQEKRAFEDRFGDAQAYIRYMRPRIVELYRVLKDTGSFYYHCDWHVGHYVKIMLDQIFGFNNFQNEIVWWYGGGGASKGRFGRKHDTIFFYSKSKKKIFNIDSVREPYKWTDGQKRADGSERNYAKGKIPDDVWNIHSVLPWSKEKQGYPTQKPEALLERIIKASSNEGDVVLDGFCGCGTTLVSAESLNRKWLGIDISPTACRVMADRLWNVFKLKEGKDFFVESLPTTEKELRKLPH